MDQTLTTRDTRTELIIGCAMEVHRELGPGLLEAPYQAAMCLALSDAGLPYQCERTFPAMFRGVQVGSYRPDFIVNNEVVVEIKSVERYDEVFLAKMLTYLRVTGAKVGLIINFNRPRLIDGVKRVSL